MTTNKSTTATTSTGTAQGFLVWLLFPSVIIIVIRRRKR
jgi:hypothetical protein